MSLAAKVKQKREELEWSQEELASRMGYKSRTSINKIEMGRPVSQKIIVRLAEVLGTTPAWLMGWEEKIEAEPEKMAQRHFEILMDEDLSEIFEDFQMLDADKRKIVKDLVRSLAETKKSEV